MVRTVSAIDLAHVPDELIDRTVQVIADTVSVSVAGARTPEIAALIALDRAEGLVGEGSPGHTASVLTLPLSRAHPAHAAFLNATAGTGLELDEGVRPTGHPAMHVVPAALAVAQRLRAPGAELVRAVLAGYEATVRLFRAYRLGTGVHPHGHFGAVGAAIAVALLERADVVRAAGIAATTPILAVWQSCYDGATTRNAYTGSAARAGVRASAMARSGFTGSPAALDFAFGTVAGERHDQAALTRGLDFDDFGILHNYVKVHSSCALSHSAIEAGLKLHDQAPQAIEAIEVDTVTVHRKIDRLPKPNALSIRFSLQYAVATALLLGRSDIDAFRYRDEVAELAKKVSVRTDAEFDRRYPDAAPARVTVFGADSSRLTATVDNPRGHWRRPLSESDRWHKFAMLVADSRAAEVWWDRLLALTEAPDCATLLEVG
jgi:2-methylcitrate dehydratase PrpD